MYRVKTTGDIIQLVDSNTGIPCDSPIRKISATEYVDKRTGEVKTITRADRRTDDISALRRSLARGRDVINTNITHDNVHNVSMITLTYRDNMQDTRKLYHDWDNYNRLCLNRYGRHEYITAVEPQGRGAWHIHALIIWDSMPYLPIDDISQAWGKGYVKIQRLDSVDNVGAYLSAYLTDDYNTDEHMRIKHARLSMYPRGMRPIRWSRGCKLPNVAYVDYQTYAQKKTELSTHRTYSATSTIDVISATTQQVRTIKYHYDYYNVCRTTCQDVGCVDEKIRENRTEGL